MAVKEMQEEDGSPRDARCSACSPIAASRIGTDMEGLPPLFHTIHEKDCRILLVCQGGLKRMLTDSPRKESIAGGSGVRTRLTAITGIPHPVDIDENCTLCHHDRNIPAAVIFLATHLYTHVVPRNELSAFCSLLFAGQVSTHRWR